MADTPNLPRVEVDPLASLRSSVERHAAATQANIDAGKQLEQPPPAPEAKP